MDSAYGNPYGSLSSRPSGSMRRKSSNLLATLSRSGTFTDTEYDPSDSASLAPSVTSSTLTANSIPNLPSQSLSAALESLRLLCQKRITTFGYLKKAHEGKVHYFDTVLLTRAELEAEFEHSKMTRRTMRFALLGISLAALLDITTANDYLKNLAGLVNEFDALTDEKLQPRMRNLFRPAGKGQRKNSTGSADFMLLLQDNDMSYFFSPNIAFELDYFQVFFTLCDMLVEIYQKILNFLGPSSSSPIPPSSSSQQPQSSSASINSSVGLINPISVGLTIGGDRAPGAPGAVGLSQTLVDYIVKIDGKLKKIIQQITKDLDRVAKKSLKEELDSLAGGDSSWGDTLSSLGDFG